MGKKEHIRTRLEVERGGITEMKLTVSHEEDFTGLTDLHQ